MYDPLAALVVFILERRMVTRVNRDRPQRDDWHRVVERGLGSSQFIPGKVGCNLRTQEQCGTPAVDHLLDQRLRPIGSRSWGKCGLTRLMGAARRGCTELRTARQPAPGADD